VQASVTVQCLIQYQDAPGTVAGCLHFLEPGGIVRFQALTMSENVPVSMADAPTSQSKVQLASYWPYQRYFRSLLDYMLLFFLQELSSLVSALWHVEWTGALEVKNMYF